jgi:hypothetical protein
MNIDGDFYFDAETPTPAAVLAAQPPTSLLLRHCVAKSADNRHYHRATHAAADDVLDQGADIQARSSSSRFWGSAAKHSAQNLADHAAANGTGNGIPGPAHAQIFENRAGSGSADGPGDDLNDQVYEPVFHVSPS